jgi:cell division protein FtsA
MSERPFLALDIGTRKVAGLVAIPQADGLGLKVLAARMCEHSDRAMLDGQVHKVEAVAEVVRRVKAELEADTGLTLTDAAVAAAGRALLTESSLQTRRFPYPVEITREHVLALELAGARAAQAAVRGREKNHHLQGLHCVGFSTIQFTLDGQGLDDLVGHQGHEISAQVLATFLPRQVVDSLMAVLRRADLTASSLTLEPIAAIEVTIPPDLRRMNLTLVDIGAGTSDIAVTRAGSVFAYAMVTEAGDEITEKISEHYLVDFGEAERIKRSLEPSGDHAIHFKTILGQARSIPAPDILKTIRPDVTRLGQAIATSILSLNQTAPRAVVMVGGGSATPGLGPLLAEALGIEANRVGVRGPETIAHLDNPTGRMMGIEGVTLFGIAFSALKGRSLPFVNATVNHQPVQMLSLTGKPTVFDALLSAGREVRKLYPRPGAAITYTLGGRLQTLAGQLGNASHLAVQGAAATLDTEVPEGGAIEFLEAVDGTDAVLLPEMIASPSGPHWCSLNGKNIELDVVLACQDQPVAPGLPLPDRAELEWVSDRTLAELVPDLAEQKTSGLTFRVNGAVRKIEGGSGLIVNGRPVNPDYRPRPDDCLEWQTPPTPKMSLRELVRDIPLANPITVIVNGRPRTLDAGGSRVLVNGRPAAFDEAIPDHSEIFIEAHPESVPTLSQVLEGLNLTPPKSGAPLKLLVDGKAAAFTTPLRDGCRVEISFG